MKPSTVRVLKDYTKKSLTSITEKDFFGIANLTSKDVAGAFNSQTTLPHEKILDKYNPLLNKRNKQQNEELESDATFGSVRFDKDNIPKVHGQFEKNNLKNLYETTDIMQLYMPDEDNNHAQKFTNDYENNNHSNNQNNSDSDINIEGYNKPYKIVEISPEVNLNRVLKLFDIRDDINLNKIEEESNRYKNVPPLKFFFCKELKILKNNEIKDEEKVISSNENKLSDNKIENFESNESSQEFSMDSRPKLGYNINDDEIPIEDLDPESEEYYRRNAELMKNLEWDSSIDEEFNLNGQPDNPKPMNALDYLKEVRAQRLEPTAKGLKHRIKDNLDPFGKNIELDSKGFRIYRNQVIDWSKLRKVEIQIYIKNSIIYNNYGILAVNKPYGIASHEEDKKKELYDLNSLMQELAPKFRYEKLYLAHRLDKSTTGVILFATNQEKANQLNKLFKSGQISKTYWCITRGVPNPPAAIIDIPIGQFAIAGKVRSCVCPERVDKFRQFSKKYREARRAITEYKVLREHKGAALVEVKPRTGVKHQIRCHTSFGLGTPILGDHKYSLIEKIAPQKLTHSILKALHLRQEKARTLPIHLHAKSIMIPGAKANGESLFIKAGLPSHFIDNMKALKLSN